MAGRFCTGATKPIAVFHNVAVTGYGRFMSGTAIAREFPNAIDADLYVASTVTSLSAFGFTADNTIACVGTCRDELTRALVDSVSHAWGEAFNFSSLAGSLTLGRTGFAAARGHAPRVAGRERFVFMTMPHIGIDDDEVLGMVNRRGQQNSSTACGALVALIEEFAQGDVSRALDPDDLELSLLRQRLHKVAGTATTIAALTRLARQVFLKDLEQLIANADMTNVDFAVFSGIQIHTPSRELVWPAEAYAVVNGERRDL